MACRQCLHMPQPGPTQTMNTQLFMASQHRKFGVSLFGWSHNFHFHDMISYPQALATGITASRALGSTESSPWILASPREGLISVPRRTEGTHCIQIPPMLLWVVEMVGRPNQCAFSWWARTPTVALASLWWRAVLICAPAVTPLAAAQPSITNSPSCLSPTLLCFHHAPAAADHC